MHPLSIELVKRGFVVLSIDLRGHGSSEGDLGTSRERTSGLALDMKACVEYLEDLGFVDRIGLVGHSMGGGTAMATAEQYPYKTNATVAIGALSTSIDFENVSNLLVAYGLYEQDITHEEALALLEAYTGLKSGVELNTQYGDFDNGNATRSVVGPYSEHLAEVFYDVIPYETMQWFERAFNGVQPDDIQLTAHYLMTSLIVSYIGCLMLLFVIISCLGSSIFRVGQSRLGARMTDGRSPKLPILGYPIVMLIALVVTPPVSEVFDDVFPMTMLNSVFAMLVVGPAIGVTVVSLLLSRSRGRWEVRRTWAMLGEMSSTSL